jgi:hypothetical protein
MGDALVVLVTLLTALALMAAVVMSANRRVARMRNNVSRLHAGRGRFRRHEAKESIRPDDSVRYGPGSMHGYASVHGHDGGWDGGHSGDGADGGHH